MNQPPLNRLLFAQRVSDAVVSVLGELTKAVILKGSTLKPEEFIEGYSDLDLHVFVDPSALRAPRVLSLDYALSVQRALGGLAPSEAGFDKLQVIFIDATRYPADWTPPTPGTYRLLHGTLPDSAAPLPPEQAQALAKERLKDCRRMADSLLDSIVDKPDSALTSYTRLAGTILKGGVFSADAALTIGLESPTRSFSERLNRVNEAAFGADDNSPLIRFFQALTDWQAIKTDTDRLRALFQDAVVSLDALAEIVD